MSTPYVILTALLAAAASFLISMLVVRTRTARGLRDAKSDADRLISLARSEAETEKARLLVDAREQALEIRSEAERELAAARKQHLSREEKLGRREELFAQQEDSFQKQRRGLEATQTRLAGQLKQIQAKQAEADQLLIRRREALEQVSGLSREAAAKQFMQTLETELEGEIGGLILRHQRRVTETAESKGREILLTAIQRYASAHTADSTTSTVDIPSDDVKGRIIGREGRNVRAFEKATGVDVIIDDTPGVVIVSGFDPVRREIARLSLEKLIDDGRIHPSKIEEVVAATIGEIDALVMRKGREAADEVNVPGLADRVIQMLGRLHFRTSYSQNVLRHSVEVAFLSGLLAEMLGMDAALARRAGLLHDIGKAADHELEGGHPKIGADLLRRHNEPPEVVHAALGHHDEIVTEHPYTMLVATGDACSASRPGARRESLERYIKRMEELEQIAKRFEGVQQAFAIQAGRELRVIINADKADDRKAAKVCRDIAQAFERELTYPGEIKVTVVRETRFVETAK